MLPRQPDGAVCWHNGFRREPMLDLRRREVIAVLSGVVMILPLGARAVGLAERSVDRLWTGGPT
jgi:hypothetical protein